MNFFNFSLDEEMRNMFIRGDVLEMVKIFGKTKMFENVGVYLFHA